MLSRGVSDRKAQITVFIIIGIVAVILIVLLTFLLTREAGIDELEETQVTQQRLQPVEAFIAECLEQTSKQALDLIGSQGGWISYENPEITGQSFEFSENPTESDGLELVRQGPKIPYWYYLESRNNCGDCRFASKAPSLDLISQQISWYVDNNIKQCFANFEEFENQNFNIEELGELKTNTLIADQNIVLLLDYPIKFELNGRETRVQEHRVDLDINFKRLYELAQEITKVQQESSFLEYNTMNIVSAYSSLDSNKLPPIADASPGPGKIVWSKLQSQNLMKQFITHNVGQITVPGTNNFHPQGEEEGDDFSLRQAASYSLVLPLFDVDSEEYEEYHVSFAYMNWPIFFDISPSDGDLVRPREISSLFQGILQIFVQNYRFFYDISYPVMVEVRDTEAFNQEGYSFIFALEANVRNNDPLRPGEQFYLTPLGAPSATLFSSEDSRISGNIQVEARDDSSRAVEGVNIQYNCASESVYMGLTNSRGVYSSRFPICYGGFLSLSKQGYFTYNHPLNTEVGQTEQVEANMSKFVRKTAKVKIITTQIREDFESIPVGTPNIIEEINTIINRAPEITARDTVMYSITKIPENEFEEPYTKFLYFDNDNKELELDLVPGRYEVNANYYDQEGFTIPATTIEAGGEEITLDGVEFKPAPLGGTYLGEEIGHYFQVTREDLDADNELELYVMKFNAPSSHEELGVLGGVQSLSEEYHRILTPRFK